MILRNLSFFLLLSLQSPFPFFSFGSFGIRVLSLFSFGSFVPIASSASYRSLAWPKIK